MKYRSGHCEAERIEREFEELPENELLEALKCLKACGANSCIRESATAAIEKKKYPYFLKLEALDMRKKMKEPELL
ncbi:MAG: hypothetical protein WC637_12295 [Victivallales bacterium]